MVAIRIRSATKTDAKALVPFILSASGGIVEYLLTDAVSGFSPTQILRIQITGQAIPFSYRYIHIAETNDGIVGIIHGYASRYLTSSYFQRMSSNKSKQFIDALYCNLPKNSFYLHSLAVLEKCRGQGIGKKLLEKAKQNALQNKLDNITLHVWADNTQVISLYQKTGYRIIEHIPVKRKSWLPHDEGMILMQLNI